MPQQPQHLRYQGPPKFRHKLPYVSREPRLKPPTKKSHGMSLALGALIASGSLVLSIVVHEVSHPDDSVDGLILSVVMAVNPAA